LVEAAYPTLARALRSAAAAPGGPTMDDAATAAVENKGSGAPVDPGVVSKVGAHLGVDFGGVRVHRDPIANEASAAIGARAFAHGSDVFLGANEAPTDLGLMAHELTHVAQQGGAGAPGAQRKVNVGEANSPAEREADAVAGGVTGGGPPERLLVDGGTPAPGQALKASFIAQLRDALAAASTTETLPAYAAIENFFVGYTDRPAAELEAVIHRFAPPTQAARDAPGMIAAIMARLAVGVRQWSETGQLPPEVASLAPASSLAPTGSAGAAGPVAARSLRAPDGRETLASIEATLGPGVPVDVAMASRVSSALGTDVSGARIHTGPLAAAKAAEAGAVAFAVGNNIVMGSGAPSTGSIDGDALLAHELVHTAQQADAARDPAARRKPLGAESAAAEDVADRGAVGVLVEQRGAASKTTNALRDWAKTELQLQRCDKTTPVTPTNGTFATVAPAVRAAPNATAREAALVTGIAGATQRLGDLKSRASSGGEPIASLRRTIISETGVGGPGRALDLNPYVTLQDARIEAVWRAWAENPSGSVEPWTLLALWVKEGLSASSVPNTIPANDANDARAIYRSQVYYQNMGADHYIHFTAGAGDNQLSSSPGTGAAQDAAFHAGIAAQVAAGRLPRDIGPEINAELHVTPAPGAAGGFVVTATPRFQQLSLMLVDSFFRENRTNVVSDLAAHGASATGADLDAMGYMRWNMGPARLDPMLGRSMAPNRDPDGSTPSLPTWALHREVKTGEYDKPRANAIRFQYYQRAYRYIFEAGY
jgi:hypothetical protein